MKLLAPLFAVALLGSTLVSVWAAEATPAAAGAAPMAQAAPAEAEKAAPPAPLKPDLARGEAVYGQICASCHAADGNSNVPTQPKLAQQHAEYLVKQLEEFKAGKRKNAIMQGMASTLTDDDMKNVAYWLHSKTAKAGFAKDPALVAMGERLYRGGDAERGIPACAGCHSANGSGIPVQYPRLSGQLSEYTAITLKEFREGVRTNSVQMTGVAARMNDHDIKAVADYIAGLR